MDYRKFAMNTAETAIALSIVDFMRLNDVIESNNPLVNYAKSGVLWSLADELLDIYRTSTSNLLEGKYYSFIDASVFNGLIIWAVEMSGVGSTVNNLFDNLPFDDRINLALTNGVLKVSAKMLAELINAYWQESPLYALTNITAYIRNSGRLTY